MRDKLQNLENLTNGELQSLYLCKINYKQHSIDSEKFKD